MNHVKKLYDKMVDNKRYGITLLAVGSFFYLGVIIPTEVKILNDLYLLMGTSSLFLGGAIFFFIRSKLAYNELLDSEEGIEYLSKK
ncbi:YrhC family protein [Bacillus dakarensis]|uniref:YrhC family protein n=1 Tax=Robertmurraya dakarensis TaxID=1926278 RepID=UPI000980DF0E|nr:YrhC family protein [Bacillus dakarensis]